MKQQKEFYTIAKDGTNDFLKRYENNVNSLTFKAVFINDVRDALIFEKGVEKTEKAMHNIAEAVGGRLVKIKAEYEITEEDGSELHEPDESIEKCDHDVLNNLFKKMLGLSDD